MPGRKLWQFIDRSGLISLINLLEFACATGNPPISQCAQSIKTSSIATQPYAQNWDLSTLLTGKRTEPFTAFAQSLEMTSDRKWNKNDPFPHQSGIVIGQ
jgi:hypothetical protein